MKSAKRWASSVALLLTTLSGVGHAACFDLKKINGLLTDVPIACEALDRPVPCSRETLLPNGSRLIEDRPCAPHEQRTVQQVEREEEAAKLKQCGKDFGATRIGMRLDRFELCTDGTVFVAETQVKGALIETFRSTFYVLQVRDGRIVAFTRK